MLSIPVTIYLYSRLIDNKITVKKEKKMTKSIKNLFTLLVLGAALMVFTGCDQVTAIWETSGHADTAAQAFAHWDEDGEIPTSCAKCHSAAGLVDFAADGTVDSAVAVSDGSNPGITCDACHDDNVEALTSVTFPSGVTISNLGSEATCMQCHQGRESGASIEDQLVGITDEDNATASLSFKNIHYASSAATLYGSQAKSGYEYAGTTYKGLAHSAVNTCTGCHDNHSLEVKVEEANCAMCHSGANTIADLADIRYNNPTDWDGDGNTTEGISAEITGTQTLLYTAIQEYATDVLELGIVYDSHAYPYFFKDTNENGTADIDEAVYANAYKPYSARLLKAVYNYQVSMKDAGAYAHNPKYILQLLTDSIEDLESAL